MKNKQLLIIYYSQTGNTKKMAEFIAKGAQGQGITIKMKSVEDCKLNDLVDTDGIIIGSPTYFSNVAWQIKKLIDESIDLYEEHQLGKKIGGCFTSAGTHRDSKGCIKMMEIAFGFHHKIKMMPGIVSTSDDKEEEISKTCQQYGMKIAKEILSIQAK